MDDGARRTLSRYGSARSVGRGRIGESGATVAAVRIALVCLTWIALLFGASTSAFAAEPPAWCAPETETLPSAVCHFDPGGQQDRRTLVVFLHGVVPKSSTWQWTQQRAIIREAKQFHFEAIMPRALPVGPDGAAGFAWPGSAGRDPSIEQDLIDQWTNAQHILETRAGKPFDEVFVVGFSSGAYFATSLAVRDRLKASGYVVLAGGAASKMGSDVDHKVPIFIGVSARDNATAPGARALGAMLTAHDWPHKVDEQPVGHMVSDLHVAHALTYLRAIVDRTSVERAAPSAGKHASR